MTSKRVTHKDVAERAGVSVATVSYVLNNGPRPVAPETRLVITEGNYLLLDHGHWADVAGLLDEVWYVEPDEPLRLQRLLQRHMAFGRSEAAARDWIASTDEPNARLIEASRPRADWVLHWND